MTAPLDLIKKCSGIFTVFNPGNSLGIDTGQLLDLCRNT